MANNGLFELGKDYLQYCRDISKRNGALLIFDEVITGFRLHWGGAKAYYGISPDIGTYGKIIGGGMPVGAVAAPRAIMENLAPCGQVYQAGTLSGNPLAMVAGVATLKGLERTGFYNHIKKIGSYLDKKMQTLAVDKSDQPFGYRRVESLFWICLGNKTFPAWPKNIPPEAKPLYAEKFHNLLKKGVYTAPSAYEVGFLSAAHTEADIDKFVGALSQS
jgi:glutamate-1-semialdehyde 2,1-aminomutase